MYLMPPFQEVFLILFYNLDGLSSITPTHPFCADDFKRSNVDNYLSTGTPDMNMCWNVVLRVYHHF